MKSIKGIKFKQIAFTFSILVFILWMVLGTSATLTWFNDTSNDIRNVFHAADFDLQVFHKNEEGNWDEIKMDEAVFDDTALYEPGYVQVVYVKVKNNGDLPFKWKTTVTVDKFNKGINVYGDEFKLQDYLRFGVIQGDSEADIINKTKTRSLVSEQATEELSAYSKEYGILNPGKETFLAIVVRMPEEVTNVANYVPPHQPEVFLGLVVTANQVPKN